MAPQNRRKAEAEEKVREPSSSSDEEESTENEELLDESDTESEGGKNTQPPPKKPLNTLPPPSSSDDDTGSDSDTDLQPSSIPKLSQEMKPVSSKPTGETSQASKRSRSKPTTDAQPSRVSSKRTADSLTPQKEKESKRAKKKEQDDDMGVDDESLKKTGDDTKKQLFQRLWSEDDEIAMLKGVIEYAETQGIAPSSADMGSFFDFIKKSLHIDASKSQLTEKMRRLKKKFLTNLKRSSNGNDRTFSNPHDQTVYDLSKKIWGTGAESNGALATESARSSRKGRNARTRAKTASPNMEKKANGQKDIDMESAQAAVAAATPPSKTELFYKQPQLGDSILEKEIMNRASQLITGPKKMELEDKWRQLMVKEMEVYLERLDYMREQTSLVLEAMKSPAN